jgi:hypothetical protein
VLDADRRVGGLAALARSRVATPTVAATAATAAVVVVFHLWFVPSNPPGFIRDEASIAYNAFTISQSLRDQDGGLLPLYLVSFDDYKSPLFVYLLAGVFRVTGPSADVARGVAGACVLAAVFALGLLAWRRTRSAATALLVIALAGATPWLFELGRVAYETALEPLVVCVLLLALDRAARRKGWSLGSAVAVGLALGVLTYVYAGGRLLAPLYAAALVVVAAPGRLRWLGTAWATFGATLLPLVAYWHNHAGALTARYQSTTFITGDMSLARIVRTAGSNYVHDVNLWHWVTSGDPKPYVHTYGTPALLGGVVLLAAAGLALVLRSHRDDPWWRFVIAALVLAPVPAALTEDRFYELRLAPLPVLLVVLAVPAVAALVAAARRGWAARAVAVALGALVAVQVADFADAYRTGALPRGELFEAGVPALLDRAFGSETVFIDYDDRSAQTHALWYAAEHGLPRSRVSILSDGAAPPVGSMVFGRLQPCDYTCVELARSYEYWIARAAKPS